MPNIWGPSGPGIGSTSTIRKGDWKLIYYHKDRSFELFNLANDIGESINLSQRNPTKLNEMRVLLGNYLREVKAQMPFDKQQHKLVEYPDLL